MDMDTEYNLMLREISAGILKPEYYLKDDMVLLMNSLEDDAGAFDDGVEMMNNANTRILR